MKEIFDYYESLSPLGRWLLLTSPWTVAAPVLMGVALFVEWTLEVWRANRK